MAIELPGTLGEAFEAQEILGQGAFGTVVRARDRALDRLVAIKFLSVRDEEAQARFLREAQALARLDHPGVVRVYAHGIAEGTPYLVMELLSGRSLDRVRCPGDPVALMLEVASALEAIHACEVVHRDLKPANLVLADGGRPVLTDFGLATDPSRTALTRTGQILGTPAYMAPEVIRGEPSTPAHDWYSWGVTLYALLEGAPPCPGDEGIAAALAHEAAPLRFGTTPEDSAAARLIRACLDPDPRRRPAGRAALEELLEEDGQLAALVGAVTGDTWEGPRVLSTLEAPVASRRRLPALAMGLWVLLGLGALGWWSLGGEVEAPGSPEQAAGLAGAPGEGAAPAEPVVPASMQPLGENAAGYATYRNPRDGAVMVLVPAGSFESHASRTEEPGQARRAEVPAFLIDTTEVTQARYLRFLDATGTAPPPIWSIHGFEDEKPAVGTSWDDAAAYCRWAGGRLPTGLEWERAARGDDGRDYPWGDDPPGSERANYRHDDTQSSVLVPVGRLRKVGSFPAGTSFYGLVDMAGNASEWCAGSSTGEPLGEDRETRGGSWSTSASKLPAWHFHAWSRETRDGDTGFRVVRDLEVPRGGPSG